jgi:hypothetical protein
MAAPATRRSCIPVNGEAEIRRNEVVAGAALSRWRSVSDKINDRVVVNAHDCASRLNRWQALCAPASRYH